ncbi:MAG: mercury resistance system periplasmic binding protein MerP [Proteobacteria bacterium]|nr:mercury resistance system periplasmic binding protein MerP [Pseudomonadota bacterium]
MRKLTLVVTLTALFSAPVFAGMQTVTLSVPGMTCATCPITVKNALTQVDGVIEAKVTYEPKEAVVTFDDGKTSVDTLTEATKNAGYPSGVKE